MKALYLFFLPLLLFIGGCSSDDDKEFTYTPETLARTLWKGKLVYPEPTNEVVFLTIAFGSETTGYSFPDDDTYNVKDFGYKFPGRVIIVYGSTGAFPSESWWIKSSTEKTMVLVASPETAYETTLYLTRVI